MKKRFFWLAILVCFSFLLTATGYAYSHNLSRIVSPKWFEKKDYHPVEIVVKFCEGARPETFKAWLNHQNITNKFEPIENGMRALVLPEDGLRYRVIGESPGRQPVNVLKTKIKGAKKKTDIDVRIFFVEYSPVQTSRDEQGIWHITGGSLYDVFEAYGYAVATDRLWQTELYRRQAQGKLSEILGEGLVGTDMYMRTYGYSDEEYQSYFEDLDIESRIMIQAYVNGLNRHIEEIYEDNTLLPYEFKASGFVPEFWEVRDVMAWAATLQRNFDSEGMGTAQIDNAALLQDLKTKFGTAALGMFEDLRWINDPNALTMIPENKTNALSLNMNSLNTMALTLEANSNSGPILKTNSFSNLRQAARELADMQSDVDENLKKINAKVKLGSYAWVVAGSKTQSGNPIIYSGPQAGFSVPVITQEGSIRGGGINVSGASVPGIPGILVGRTPYTAWSVQVGHGHTVDHYLEAASDVFLHRTETIKVKGKAEVLLPVYRTSHGPVIYPMPYNPQNPGDTIIAWKFANWGSFEFLWPKATLGFSRATNMDEFGVAIEMFPISAHFCYADRGGNIAYWMAGRDPVRPDGVDTRFPQLGDGSQEWPQPVTLKPRSTDRNTHQGFYGGWNNKTNPDYDNIPAGTRYRFGPFHRAHVIDDYLSYHDNLTFEEVRGLALNIATTDSLGSGGNPWEFVKDDFIAAVEADPSPERLAALALLAGWDGHFVAGGESQWVWGTLRADAWVLMDEWIREVLKLTFDNELAGIPQDKALLIQVLLHGLAGDDSGVVNNYDWFQNQSNPSAPQTANTIIVQALDNVLVALGPEPWDDPRGIITFNHMLFGKVWEIPFSSRSTYAHCVEMGSEGPVRIESMFPLGQSGTILGDPPGVPVFDAHFFTMAPFFDDFSHMPFPLFD